jgi:hypothetical protein
MQTIATSDYCDDAGNGAEKRRLAFAVRLPQHVKCVEAPVCCLVAAVLESEPWRSNGAGDSPLSH